MVLSMRKGSYFNESPLLTGSHPRHFYLVNKLAELNIVSAHVIEKRGAFIPQPPSHLEDVDRTNFIRHFADRDKAEHLHFKGNEK